MKFDLLKSGSLVTARMGSAAGLLAALLLSACLGAGSGGYANTNVSAYDNTNVGTLASFEGGVSGITVLNSSLNTSSTAASVAPSTTDVTAGSSSLQVTLNDATAWIGYATISSSGSMSVVSAANSTTGADWSSYRTLLVDINSANAINYGDLNLRLTNAGGSTCIIPVTQATNVVAGAETTLAFRLNWGGNCALGGTTIASLYLELGGGTASTSASNIVYVANMRLTKAKQVMVLGDSIAGSPGCWRKSLWNTLQTDGFTNIDMVGIRNNESECGLGWNAGVSAYGGMHATTVGAHIGLANASRTDSVYSYSASPAVMPGNLAVWLEKTRPEMVVMNLATNDLWDMVSPGSILSGYDTLLAQMRASNPKSRLVVAKITFEPFSSCAAFGDPLCAVRAAKFDSALTTWAACNSTPTSPITIADLTKDWVPSTMTIDGVHPNTAGATVMAANWTAAVESALSTLDSTSVATSGTCPADIKDGAVSTSNGMTTAELTSFKYGIGSFNAYNQSNNTIDSTYAAVTDSTTGETDGVNSAQFTVSSIPAGSWAGIGVKGNGGVSDWTGYTTLNVDVTVPAGGNAFSGKVFIQSGATWQYSCVSPMQTIAAGTSGTLTLDLTTCINKSTTYGAGADLTAVDILQVGTWTTGTYYFDNFRLTNAVAAPPAPVTATDSANGTISSSGGVTTALLTSFANGVSGLSVNEWDTNTGFVWTDVSSTTGSSITLERSNPNPYATEGNSSLAITVPPTASSSFFLGFTPAITDWSAYSAINFDVQTAVTYWWPQVTIFYSGGSLNCTVSTGANATTSTSAPTTVSISLSGCASQLSGQTVSGVGIYQQNGYGTVHYDNIRLTGGTPAPAPTQLVLQSFESGISALTVYDTSWAAQPTYGSIAQSTSNATAGNYSAAITDTAPASADILIGMDFGGADWSSYRYLKMDVTNSVISSTFYTQLIIASGSGWAQQCYTPMSGNSPTTTAAGKVTLVFDMSTCNNSGAGYTIDKTTIQRVFFLQQLWTGVSYVDNIRLSN